MVFTKIVVRRDTLANWTANNPSLSVGEICYESPTASYQAGRLKIGKGTSWSTTQYIAEGTSSTSLANITTNDDTSISFNVNAKVLVAGTTASVYSVSDDQYLAVDVAVNTGGGGVYTVNLPASKYFTYDYKYIIVVNDPDGVTSLTKQFIYDSESGVTTFVPTFEIIKPLHVISRITLGLSYKYKGPTVHTTYSIRKPSDVVIKSNNILFNRTTSFVQYDASYSSLSPTTLESGESYKFYMFRQDSAPQPLQILLSPSGATYLNYFPFTLDSLTFNNNSKFTLTITNPSSGVISSIRLSGAAGGNVYSRDNPFLTSPYEFNLDGAAVFGPQAYTFTVTFGDGQISQITATYVRTIAFTGISILDSRNIRPVVTLTGSYNTRLNAYAGATASGTIITSKDLLSTDATLFDSAGAQFTFKSGASIQLSVASDIFQYGTQYSFEIVDRDVPSVKDDEPNISSGSITAVDGTPFTNIVPSKDETTAISADYKWTGPAYTGIYAECIEYNSSGTFIGVRSLSSPGDAANPTRYAILLPASGTTRNIQITVSNAFVLTNKYAIRVTFPGGATIVTQRVTHADDPLAFIRFEGQKFIRLKNRSGAPRTINLQTVISGTSTTVASASGVPVTTDLTNGDIVQFLSSGSPYLFLYNTTYQLNITTGNINSTTRNYQMNLGAYSPSLYINNSVDSLKTSFTGGRVQTASYTMIPGDYNRSDPRITFTLSDVTVSPTAVGLFTNVPYTTGTPLQATAVTVGVASSGSRQITFTFGSDHGFTNSNVVQMYNGVPDQFNIKSAVTTVTSRIIRLNTSDTRFSDSDIPSTFPFAVKMNDALVTDSAPKTVSGVSYVAPGGGITYRRLLITCPSHGYAAGTYVKITGISNGPGGANIPIQGSVITNNATSFYIGISYSEIPTEASTIFTVAGSARSSKLINPVNKNYRLDVYHSSTNDLIVSSPTFSLYSTLFINANCVFNSVTSVNSTITRKYNLTSYTVVLEQAQAGTSAWSPISATTSVLANAIGSLVNDYFTNQTTDTLTLNGGLFFKRGYKYRTKYSLRDPTQDVGNNLGDVFSSVLENSGTITTPTLEVPEDATGTKINLTFTYSGGPSRVYVILRPPTGDEIGLSTGYIQLNDATTLTLVNQTLDSNLTNGTTYDVLFRFNDPNDNGNTLTFSNALTYNATNCIITQQSINIVSNPKKITYRFEFSGRKISSAFGNLTFIDTSDEANPITITPARISYTSDTTQDIVLPVAFNFAANHTYRLSLTLPDTSIPTPVSSFTFQSLTVTSPQLVFSDSPLERGIGTFTATLSRATSARSYKLRERSSDGASIFVDTSDSPEVRFTYEETTDNNAVSVSFSIPSKYLRYGKIYTIEYSFTSLIGQIATGFVNSSEYTPYGYDILVFAGQSNMAGRDSGLNTLYGYVNPSNGKRYYENTYINEIPFNNNMNYTSTESTTSLTHVGASAPIAGSATVPNVCHLQEELTSSDPADWQIVSLTAFNTATNTIDFITEYPLPVNSQIYFSQDVGNLPKNSFYFLKTRNAQSGRTYNYTRYQTNLALNSSSDADVDLTGTSPTLTLNVPLSTFLAYTASTTLTVEYTGILATNIEDMPVFISTGTPNGVTGITNNPAYVSSVNFPAAGNTRINIKFKNALAAPGPLSMPANSVITVFLVSARISSSSIVHGTTSAHFKSAADSQDSNGVTLAYDFTKLYSSFISSSNKFFSDNRRICTVFRPRGGTDIVGAGAAWDERSSFNLRTGLINQLKCLQRASGYVNDVGLPVVSFPTTGANAYSRHRIVMFGWLQGEADCTATPAGAENWTDKLRGIITDVFDQTNTTYDDVIVLLGNIELTQHQRIIDQFNYSGIADPTSFTASRALRVMQFLKTIDRYRDALIDRSLKHSVNYANYDLLYRIYGISSTGLYSIDQYTLNSLYARYSAQTAVHYSARAERALAIRFYNTYLALRGYSARTVRHISIANDVTPMTYAYNVTTGRFVFPSSASSYDFVANPVGCLLTATNGTNSTDVGYISSVNRYAIIPEHSGQGIDTEGSTVNIDKAYLPYFTWTDTALYDNFRAHTRSGVRVNTVDLTVSNVFSSSSDSSTVRFLPTRPTYIDGTGGAPSSLVPDPNATAKAVEYKLLQSDLRTFLQTISEEVSPIWTNNNTDEIMLYNRAIRYDNTQSIDVPSKYVLQSQYSFICPITSVFSNKIGGYLATKVSLAPPQVVDPSLYLIGSTRGSSRTVNSVDLLRTNLSVSGAAANAGLIVAGIFPNSSVSNYYVDSGGGSLPPSPTIIGTFPPALISTTPVGFRRFGSQLFTSLESLPRTNTEYDPGTATVQGTGCIFNRIIANAFDWTMFYSEAQYNTQSILPPIEWNNPTGAYTPVNANTTGVTTLDRGSQYAGIIREGSAETDPVSTSLSSILNYTNTDFHYFYLYNTGTAVTFRLKNFLPNKKYTLSYYISTKSGIVPGNNTSTITSVTGNYPYLSNSFPVKVYTTTPTSDSGKKDHLDITLTRILPPTSTPKDYPYRIRIKINGNDAPGINNMITFDRILNAGSGADTKGPLIFGASGGVGGMYLNKSYYVRTIYPVPNDSLSYDVSISEFPTAGPASQAQVGAFPANDTSDECVTFPAYTTTTDFPVTGYSNSYPIKGQLYTGKAGIAGYAYVTSISTASNNIVIQTLKTHPDLVVGQRFRVLKTDTNGGFAGMPSTALFYIFSIDLTDKTNGTYNYYTIKVSNSPSASSARIITSTFTVSVDKNRIYLTPHSTNSEVGKTTFAANDAAVLPNTVSVTDLTLSYGPPYVGQPIRFLKAIGSASVDSTFLIASISNLTNSGNIYTFRFSVATSLQNVQDQIYVSLGSTAVVNPIVQFLYPDVCYGINREFLRNGTISPSASSITDYTTQHDLWFKNGTNSSVANTNIATEYLHGTSGKWDGSWKKLDFTFNTPDYPSQIINHGAYLQFGPLPSVRNIPNRYIKIIQISNTNFNSILVKTATPHGLKPGFRINKLIGITGAYSAFNNLTNQNVGISSFSSTQFRIAITDSGAVTPTIDAAALSNSSNPNAPSGTSVDYTSGNAFIVVPHEFTFASWSYNNGTKNITFNSSDQQNIRINDTVTISGIVRQSFNSNVVVQSISSDRKSFTVSNYTNLASSTSSSSSFKVNIPHTIEIASVYSTPGSILIVNTVSPHGLKNNDVVNAIRGLTVKQMTTISSTSGSNTLIVASANGLATGQLIYISGNSQATNNNSYLISNISGTTITVTNVNESSVTFSASGASGAVSVDATQFNTERPNNITVRTTTSLSLDYSSKISLAPLLTSVGTAGSPITFSEPYPLLVFDTNPTPVAQELEFINTSINIGGIELRSEGSESYASKVETMRASSTVA